MPSHSSLLATFLNGSPFSQETTLWAQAILRPYHLAKLVNHAHVLLLSSFICSIIAALSRKLSPIIFKKTYPKLLEKQKTNWDIHMVSMIHCIFIVWGAFKVWEDPVLKKDKVFGYDIFAGNIYAVATGYFLWDTLTSLRHIKEFGAGFVIHGASCFLVFLFGFRPFLMYYGSAYLMFELSTPFLNINWFMDKMGLTGSWMQLVNGIVLLATFFGARIVFGLYASWHTYVTVNAVRSQIPTFFLVLYSVANVVLNVLNVYWFMMMIGALRRRFNYGKRVGTAEGTRPAGKNRLKKRD